MTYKKYCKSDLENKIIDSHSHIGISIKAYANKEYPYASTIEGIYYRQQKCGIDVNVVFPFTPEMYLDIPELLKGNYKKADSPLSEAPYITENNMLLKEVYDYCPEISDRFLPFISIDPSREIQKQIDNINNLSKMYPIYGIKIVPVFCQAPITDLLSIGKPFLELAQANNWAILLHTTVHPEENYSRADLAFKVIEKNPKIRFCLAHCIGFHNEYLKLADSMQNVWVDTAALKIQVQLTYENSPLMADKSSRFQADYSDHTKVMQQLTAAFPNTIIWGTDTPAYSYICQRKQAEGVYSDFKLKAAYEDEVEALKSLSKDNQRKVAHKNTLNFIFGQKKSVRKQNLFI